MDKHSDPSGASGKHSGSLCCTGLKHTQLGPAETCLAIRPTQSLLLYPI